jgi:hypothetical protein
VESLSGRKLVPCLVSLIVIAAVADCGGGGGGGSGGDAPGGGAGVQVVSPLGTPSGSATIATVDSSGGVVTDAGGSFALTIPAGALPAPTQIKVTPLSSGTTPWQTTSGGFGITGLASLTQPVTMSIKYAGVNVQNPSADTLGVALQTGSGAWWYFPSPTWDGVSSLVVTLDPMTLSPLTALRAPKASNLDAASLWVFERIYLKGRTDLFVNDTENYEAAACNPQVLNSGNEALLSFTDGTCQTLEKSLSDVSWLVNGQPNGNSTVGTIQNQCNATTCSGHYTAPATVPADNPVSIGVLYNVTTPKINIDKSVTIHGFGKFSVKASFRDDNFPVCQSAPPTLMTDSLSFNLEALPPTPFYSVTAIQDKAAVYSQPPSPSTDITLTVDIGPEIFLATTNVTAELTLTQPPMVEVTMNGTGRTAQCTYRDNKGTILAQEPSFVGAGSTIVFQFDPDPKKFTQGLGGGPSQTVTVGPWLFDVTEAF